MKSGKRTMKKKKKKKHEQGQGQEHEKHPAGSLPEGPLVEILSRVPYKPWLALCSDPTSMRSPQTMAGFFLHNYSIGPCFINISGRGQPLVDPSLSFLRESFTLLIPEQCCGGLILCKYWKSDHFEEDEHSLVVCNPATKNRPLPFVVFTHTWDLGEVTIYSSDTGRWTTVEVVGLVRLPIGLPVFLNGTVHLMTTDISIATVDTEGRFGSKLIFQATCETALIIRPLDSLKGSLYAWGIDDNINICQLSVWALEDYGGAKWALKDTVNISELFGRIVTNMKAISYDMDSKKVHVIGTYETFLGAVSYVPCFAEWPSDI
ncbi:hypothetical protein ZWY2020_020504 [Hordeum vulgare]|nr:hypothetical protein ZWY2020_020504 [Hordeum vulgare]